MKLSKKHAEIEIDILETSLVFRELSSVRLFIVAKEINNRWAFYPFSWKPNVKLKIIFTLFCKKQINDYLPGLQLSNRLPDQLFMKSSHEVN